MFGPYIHHVAGIYGKFARAFEEAARYLPDTIFDGVNTPDPFPVTNGRPGIFPGLFEEQIMRIRLFQTTKASLSGRRPIYP